jgi:hypothetical protein
MTRRLTLAILVLVAASSLGGCASWISSRRVNAPAQTVAPQPEGMLGDQARVGDARHSPPVAPSAKTAP